MGSKMHSLTLRPAYSVKLVFTYVEKGIKMKITAKFRDTEHLCFEDTKRIMSPGKFQDPVPTHLPVLVLTDDVSCNFATH